MRSAETIAFHRRVGFRVRALRRQRRLTQAGLAELIDRSVDGISAIERGIAAPGMETLARLAQALETTPNVFFDDEHGPAISPIRAGLLADINARLRVIDDRSLKVAVHVVAGLSNNMPSGVEG